MSEHGWPDFHDDGGAHHDDLHHDDGLHHEDLTAAPDDVHEDGGYFDDAVHHHDTEVDTPEHSDNSDDSFVVHEVADVHSDAADLHEEGVVVGHDLDALPETHGEEVSTFPPLIDVGPLPEPVDGFPWIDTGSLGLVDPATVHAAATSDVDPHELAEYAGVELPPGADPWAALADSEDPATSALAKWWSEHS